MNKNFKTILTTAAIALVTGCVTAGTWVNGCYIDGPLCTVCDGMKVVTHAYGTTVCTHCDGTGIEPPEEAVIVENTVVVDTWCPPPPPPPRLHHPRPVHHHNPPRACRMRPIASQMKGDDALKKFVRFVELDCLASCKTEMEVDHEQELQDDSDDCGDCPCGRLRDGRNMGQRMLHRRAALHGLRRHEDRHARLRDDPLHPLRRHGHRAARE